MIPILIIVEGMDNTGKTTLIEQYKRVMIGLNPNINIEVIHMEKPPQDKPETVIEETPFDINNKVKYDYSKINEFQHNSYMALPDKLRKIREQRDVSNIIILDRAWISEYVYGYMYRQRNQQDIIVDNLIIEQQLMQIFGNRCIYLVYLYPSYIGFIQQKEDGKSLAVLKAKKMYPVDTEAQKSFIDRCQKEELDRFNEGFNNISIIKNKIPIQVNKDEHGNFDNSMVVQMFDIIHNQ